MDLLEFLSCRLMFTGLPYGELKVAIQHARQKGSWTESLLASARELHRVAAAAERDGRRETAAQTWRWTACAYHAASFGFHLELEQVNWARRVSRLRQLAHVAYNRALRLMPAWGAAVTLDCGTRPLRGYLRAAADPHAPVVVLVNGLDSIAEVELHCFADWMHMRGMATLALDLPACASSRPRRPRYDLENLGPHIAEWLAAHFPGLGPMGCFGVSFGGHLVARLLAGNTRFRAGVAVSPPAYLSSRELSLDRLRRMFCWTCDLAAQEAETAACAIDVAALPPPQGDLLVLQMERDELFGPEHVRYIQAWGGPAVQVLRLSAEHVGTSQFHRWLPHACDWLRQQLSTERLVAHADTHHVAFDAAAV